MTVCINNVHNACLFALTVFPSDPHLVAYYGFYLINEVLVNRFVDIFYVFQHVFRIGTAEQCRCYAWVKACGILYGKFVNRIPLALTSLSRHSAGILQRLWSRMPFWCASHR